MVGILGNISCHQQIANQIAVDAELMGLIFGLVSNRDSQTVIQCIRLLDTLLNSIVCEKIVILSKSSSEIWINLAFILQNSLNGKTIVKIVLVFQKLF